MAQTEIIKKEKTIHSPTLNTVLMVEDVLKECGELLTLSELKRKLPRKVMHQTLLQILDYLQYSGKIIIGTKGILWIYAGRKELNELIKRGTEFNELSRELTKKFKKQKISKKDLNEAIKSVRD